MKNGVAPYVPKADLERVLAAQGGANVLRDRAVLYLSHYLGLRAKELASLRIGDVHGDQGIREVVRLMATMTKGGVFRESFLVHPEAREALRKYLVTRSLRTTDAPLFLSQKGGAFSPNTLQRLLANLYKKGHVKASSHSGRRSFAIRLNEGGADIYAIKQMMGHSSIATTQRYLESSPERLKKFAHIL